MPYPMSRAQLSACGSLFLAAALLTAGDQVAEAGMLTTIERKIRQEPEYRTSYQEYCLLVFGADAKTRVWIVRDGVDIYVDTNANGDLTESGEKHANVYRPIVKSRGDTKLNLTIEISKTQPSRKVRMMSWGHNREGQWHIHLDSEERTTFTDGPVITTLSSRNAPIVHLDGPLSVVPHSFLDARQARISALKRDGFRRGEAHPFPLMAGNSGLGQGADVVHESETLLKLLHGSEIKGRLEFAGKDGLPIVTRHTWTFSRRKDP